MKNLYLLLLFWSGIAVAQPTIQQPPDLQACDNNNDGIAVFDLTIASSQVLGALDPADHTIGLFETLSDAENFVNDLGSVLNITSYTNIIPGIQTLYIGVYENSNPSLIATTTFDITVNPTPMVWDLQDLVIAEDPYDGVAIFDLTLQTPIIVNGQSGVVVQYHPTQFDAEAGTNVFPNSEAFTNESNPQRIWVSSFYTGTDCLSVGYFDLHVIENDFIVFPDANLKARLLETATPYPAAMDTEGNYLVLDATGDGEIQYGEALIAGTLNLVNRGITNMEGIQYFTNLNYLDVGFNSITNLDVSALTMLEYLNCNSNDLTSLNLGTVATIETINCYTNNLTELDISNQVNLQYLWCFTNQLTELDISQNTQLINLQVDQNQIVEMDLSTVNLNVFSCSFNELTGIDLSGQTNLESMNCSENLFTDLDLTANTQLSWLSCANNLNTTLDVTHLTNLEGLITGGSLLETVFMKNGAAQVFELTDSPNLEFICVDESEIENVQAAVNAGTNLNTVVNSFCDFTPGGDYNTITGVVTFDADNNGPDAADPVIPLVKVRISAVDGTGAAFTDNNGSYSFYTQAGDFAISPEFENQNFFDLFLPVGINFPTVDNSTVTQNFTVVANGVHPDLEVAMVPLVPSQPGFDATYKIVYKNKGNQLLSGHVFFEFDSVYLELVSAIPAPDNVLTGYLGFEYENLLPFENREIIVTLNVNAPTDPQPVNIGDVLNFTVNAIIDQGTDETPDDNVFEYFETVIGSYDPNNKLCSEGEVVSTDEIGEYLHYVINFENTGTAPAQNIVVRDILNPLHFEISSLQIMNSSHPVVARQTGNMLECIFEGINLDSGGHGNILLKIKSLSTLANGDEVANRADIFFDYNFPIETNDAVTSFESLAVGQPEGALSLTFYPNPVTDILTLKSEMIIEKLELFDLQGRLLQSTSADSQQVQIDMSSRQAGVYILKATSGSVHSILKFIKN